jgi:hypothetical protein
VHTCYYINRKEFSDVELKKVGLGVPLSPQDSRLADSNPSEAIYLNLRT